MNPGLLECELGGHLNLTRRRDGRLHPQRIRCNLIYWRRTSSCRHLAPWQSQRRTVSRALPECLRC